MIKNRHRFRGFDFANHQTAHAEAISPDPRTKTVSLEVPSLTDIPSDQAAPIHTRSLITPLAAVVVALEHKGWKDTKKHAPSHPKKSESSNSSDRFGLNRTYESERAPTTDRVSFGKSKAKLTYRDVMELSL
jgi:hypothetical protein